MHILCLLPLLDLRATAPMPKRDQNLDVRAERYTFKDVYSTAYAEPACAEID